MFNNIYVFKHVLVIWLHNDCTNILTACHDTLMRTPWSFTQSFLTMLSLIFALPDCDYLRVFSVKLPD